MARNETSARSSRPEPFESATLAQPLRSDSDVCPIGLPDHGRADLIATRMHGPARNMLAVAQKKRLA
eukprot:4046636-Pyramimonas_sp.AAC.1